MYWKRAKRFFDKVKADVVRPEDVNFMLRTSHHFNRSDDDDEAVDSFWERGRGV